MLIVCHLVHLVASVHPYLHLDVFEPIGNCGYAPTAVLFNVLLTDVTYGYDTPIAVYYRATKDPLGLEYALTVMP
jgi:hypothetical protein